MPEPGACCVAAAVAAAGKSTRMGRPKQLLPWRDCTVIATVVRNLRLAGAEPVIVTVGHKAAAVEEALEGTGAIVVFNDAYGQSEMLRSYQLALSVLDRSDICGALLAPGDQPHVPVSVLREIVDAARDASERLVIPSFNMRRGHPIYLPARLWDEVLALTETDTLRLVLDRHRDRVLYVTVDSPAILQDLDTPSDYEAYKPAQIENNSG